MKAAFLDTFAGDPVKGVPSPSAQQTQHDMCKEVRYHMYIHNIVYTIINIIHIKGVPSPMAQDTPHEMLI